MKDLIVVCILWLVFGFSIGVAQSADGAQEDIEVTEVELSACEKLMKGDFKQQLPYILLVAGNRPYVILVDYTDGTLKQYIACEETYLQVEESLFLEKDQVLPLALVTGFVVYQRDSFEIRWLADESYISLLESHAFIDANKTQQTLIDVVSNTIETFIMAQKYREIQVLFWNPDAKPDEPPELAKELTKVE